MDKSYESYRRWKHLCGGNVFIYITKTSKSRIWQARISLPGVPAETFLLRKSLRTSSEEDAIVRATNLYHDYLHKHRVDEPLGMTSWRDLVTAYEEDFPDKTKFQSDADTYLNTFFGDVRDVRDIDTALVRRFWFWRWERHKDFKKPKGRVGKGVAYNASPTPHQNTLKALEVSLKAVLNWGHQNGRLLSLPNYRIPKEIWKKAPSDNSRGRFDLQAYRQLVRKLYRRAEMIRKRETNTLKQQRVGIERVRFMVLLISNSCIRPTEAYRLQHKHFKRREGESPEEREKGVAYTEIEIPKSVAKTSKARTVITHDYDSTYRYYERFKEVLDEYDLPTGPDDFVFCKTRDPSQVASMSFYFRKLLEEFGLHKDDKGRNRVLYSLRSFGITMALERGVPIHIVSFNAGTSVRMIESNYWNSISWSLREVINKGRKVNSSGMPVFAVIEDEEMEELEREEVKKKNKRLS
tara:strand:- start:283 stop:1677 length:1395 start_codon:yes stop_codon:yes gene_type:complete